MPEYSQEYSKKKLKAAQEINKVVDDINRAKAAGIKVRGNEPKMTLRGLRSLLSSEDSLFADIMEKWESGKINAKQLASQVRSRTEKIGKQEVAVHSDTIHHSNPLELADVLDEMEPEELADFLTEEYEVRGETYGDTRQNIRGQSYTTRGHLGQTTNPRGRYKATNEFSEPGRTDISAHPRGANDPLMKAPAVKPRTRAEASEFVKSKAAIIEESRQLGAYADRDVRALVDSKLTDRGILQPGETFYNANMSDETLSQATSSLDNLADETDIAKAFKTPQLELNGGSFKYSTKGLVGRGVSRLILPSALGGAASLALGAADVQARELRAEQDPSFINKLQAGLARTEQAADAVGMVPGPQAVVAEPVGLGAGLTNIAIDVARDPMGTLKAVGGGLKYLANEFVLRGAMTAP